VYNLKYADMHLVYGCLSGGAVVEH